MALLVPGHLGGLHPLETVLVALLAFGPFVALAVVIHLQRKRDDAEAPDDAEALDGSDRLDGSDS